MLRSVAGCAIPRDNNYVHAGSFRRVSVLGLFSDSPPGSACVNNSVETNREGFLLPRQSTGKRLRFEVFKRDGYACRYCGAQPPDVVLVVDHIIPVVEGGPTTIENLNTACEPCNQGKAGRSLGLVQPRPDADLMYLEAQQEAAELRRYLEALDEKESQLAMVVERLQDLWIDCSGLEWVPANRVLRQMLTKYPPEQVEIGIRIVAPRVVTGQVNRNGWDRYLWGVIRNAYEEEPD